MSEAFTRKREEIARFIRNAANPSSTDSCTDCGKRISILKNLLIIALIGTMFPHAGLNAFTSIATAILFLLLFTFHFRNPGRLSRKFAAATLLLLSASVFSGCSPLVVSDNPEVIQLCESRYDASGETCRFGISRGVRVLGIPVIRASIEDAKLQGGISEAFVTELIYGNGLVSVDQVRVYGS